MNKLFSTIMSVCLACNVQATDLFKTSQDIALRAPSVPLITSDTYLAIWSPYNELNEGQGQAKPRNNPSDDKHRTLGSKVHHEPTGGQLDTAPVR